jgi:hypothetical protein
VKIITVVASIVLLQSLALAQSTPGKDSRPAQDTKGIFHRLEIMRRVLVRSLSEAMESKTERKNSEDRSQKEMDRQLLYSLGRNQTNNYDSRADYLPGYGAIFTLTMSLPLRPVTSSGKAGGPEKKESDGLWERVEGEVSRGTSDYGWSASLLSDGSQSERQRFEFDPAALDALKRCLAGTLGRYANRLDLGKQEWVGVSVRLLPSMNQADGSAASIGRLLADDYATGFFDLGSAGSASSQRLVFQIPVQDLAKLGEGASDADLMQKAEIDVMVSEMTLQVAGRGLPSGAR